MSSADITAIINVVNLYPVAVDTENWDLFDQIFTPDTDADWGGPAAWKDLASLKRDFATIHAPITTTQHAICGHHVVVDGDRASCISYVHARFIREAPGGNMFEANGWYDDRLVRTPAGWRIKKRVCRSNWTGGNPAVMQTAPAVDEGEHVFDSYKTEAKAGRVGHVNALLGRW